MLRRTNHQDRGRAALTKAHANNGARWLNTSEDTSNPSRKYWKAYADSKAETGEAHLMKDDPAKRLRALVPRNNMVCMFKTRESEQRTVMLPPSVRGHLAENAGAKSKVSSKKGGKN